MSNINAYEMGIADVMRISATDSEAFRDEFSAKLPFYTGMLDMLIESIAAIGGYSKWELPLSLLRRYRPPAGHALSHPSFEKFLDELSALEGRYLVGQFKESYPDDELKKSDEERIVKTRTNIGVREYVRRKTN